ncbi:MAG: c-type cytochrome [Candidatus Eisenbacteria bacterium]|nr:c-type cytochrome [Candidatus Eisenbacteria bacterium]
MRLRTAPRSVALTMIALAALTAFSASAGPSKGDAAAGKKIFVVKCVACHKPDGSGGIKLTGNPTPSWRDAKRMRDPRYNDDYLRDCIVNGKLKSGMVAWGKTGQLRPADIENLIAFIHTFAPLK